jgi:hypothetical protein
MATSQFYPDGDNSNDGGTCLDHVSSVPHRRTMVRRSSAFLIPKRFSTSISTEDLYGVDEIENFNGPYAHLRKIILSASDQYKHYTKERSWLQNAIVDDFLDNVEDKDMCITPTEPWLIFTVGARGAGKIHTIHDLVQTNRLPILSFVQVNPDAIRRHLPEFETYDKNLVNDLTRKESSFIAELLLLAAIQSGRNIVFDTVMRNTDWFSKLICNIKLLDSSSFKFAVLHINAPTELIFKRIKVRHIVVCVVHVWCGVTQHHNVVFCMVSTNRILLTYLIICVDVTKRNKTKQNKNASSIPVQRHRETKRFLIKRCRKRP